LYYPESITPLSQDFIDRISEYSNEEIAFEVIKQFIGDEIPAEKLKEIIKKTISFEFPVVTIEKNIGSLELYHGPTMAFKDVGARFMSQCLEYFNQDNKEDITVEIKSAGEWVKSGL